MLKPALRLAYYLPLAALLCFPANAAADEPLVPGTGEFIAKVGDDFEDPNWGYKYNNPKNSEELDGQARNPGGVSTNGRWFEGPLRGHPDLLKRVPTPEGGLPGSEGSLLMRSLYTGTPGRPSGHSQQDDLIVNVRKRMGGLIPVGWLPSVVVRVYFPPFEEWENRTGNTFALRLGMHGSRPNGEEEVEEYWPGMFVYFRSENPRKGTPDSAYFIIRSDRGGRDFKGPDIVETGWWTLGMSCTADGQVHYYARPGIEDLTSADRIYSQFPYGFRGRHLETFFFDLIGGDNGRTWSTSWIIDDPSLYLARQPRAAPQAARKRTRRR